MNTIVITSPEELENIVIQAIEKSNLNNQVAPEIEAEPYIYCISGLAEFLQCSVPTAQKLKNSGRIPVKQFGRKLVFIKSEVLQALSGTPYPRKTA